MKMNNKWLRNAAAIAVSAATLLAFGAVGAGTAVADDTNLELTGGNSTGSITIDSPSPGHTYVAKQIGVYKYAAYDGTSNDTLTGLSVDSLTSGGTGDVDGAVHLAAQDAEDDRAAAIPETAKTVPADNAIGWVEQNWSESSATAHTGMLRNFVTKLAKNTTIKNLFTNASSSDQHAAPASGSLTISDLPVGVYLVEDISNVTLSEEAANSDTKTIPMLVGTTVGAYTKLNSETLGKIEAKNKVPEITKTYEGVTGNHSKTAVAGDKLDFTIKTKVPVYTGYDSYKFEIHDAADEGLENVAATPPSSGFNVDNLVVKVGNPAQTLANPTDYTVTATKNGFVIKFVNIMNYPIGDDIVVTYDMKLVDAAKGTTNKAWIVHSGDSNTDCSNASHVNDPECNVPTPPTPPAGPKNYQVTVYNVHKDDTAFAFGAKYKVYKSGENDPLKFDAGSSRTITGYTDATPTAGVAEAYGYDENGTVTELGGTGISAIVAAGLPEGTYKFEQTTVSSGAQGTVKPTFTVVVANSSAEGKDSKFDFTADIWGLSKVKTDGLGHSENHADAVGTDFDVQVKNVDSLSDLPMTGGAGILLVVLLVVALGCVAVGATVMRRRDMANGDTEE